MLKTFALSLVLLSGYLFFCEIKRILEISLLQEEELLRFVKHIKEKVVAYSSPSCEWCVDFKSDALEKCGFLSGENFNSEREYFLSDKRLFISDVEREKLAVFFCERSSPSLELEIKRISDFEFEFEKNCTHIRADVAKRVKCYGVIIAASAVGIALLFL